jgi:hypothetical protein
VNAAAAAAAAVNAAAVADAVSGRSLLGLAVVPTLLFLRSCGQSAPAVFEKASSASFSAAAFVFAASWLMHLPRGVQAAQHPEWRRLLSCTAPALFRPLAGSSRTQSRALRHSVAHWRLERTA